MSKNLIIALDFPDGQQALNLVDRLDPADCILKVGNALFTRAGPDFIKVLVQRGYRIFLDLKFHDIPNTVANACSAAAELGVWMVNLHAGGGLRMMQAAREALTSFAQRPLLIAVTVLTSMEDNDLQELGVEISLNEHVLKLAGLAHKAGLDGVVCSALEVPLIKAQCGSRFLTVTPGIRLAETQDDQKRVLTPAQALEYGSDFLVVGRPVICADDPAARVKEIKSYFPA